MISNGCACPKRLVTRLVSWELLQVPRSQSWTKLINLQVSMQQQRRLERRLLMNTYNHIYGLSISGLQFYNIYVPRVRPYITYFSFTGDILNGKPINTYTKEPTTKIWLMISLTLMTLSKLDVLHLLMWWTKAQVVEGRRQVMCGSAFLTLVCEYSRHYCLPWLTFLRSISTWNPKEKLWKCLVMVMSPSPMPTTSLQCRLTCNTSHKQI